MADDEYPIKNIQYPLRKPVSGGGIKGFRVRHASFGWTDIPQGLRPPVFDTKFWKGAAAPRTKATKVGRFSFGKSPDGALLEERKKIAAVNECPQLTCQVACIFRPERGSIRAGAENMRHKRNGNFLFPSRGFRESGKTS
jgi:hypothetical protein